VDPLSRRAFWDLLYQLVSPVSDAGHLPEEGGSGSRPVTVFVTTHYMDEAEHCHRLSFIQRGKIIAYGSPAEIKSQMMRGQVLELEPSDAVGAVQTLRAAQAAGQLGIDEVELYGSLVHVVGAEMEKRRSEITETLKRSGIQPGRMAIIEPSLEDVFIACMKS